jgi:hypothetical protein
VLNIEAFVVEALCGNSQAPPFRRVLQEIFYETWQRVRVIGPNGCDRIASRP